MRYKEKLSSRRLPARSTKQRFSDSLSGQRWWFLKRSLDDFRNGFPPPCDNIMTHSQRGFSPSCYRESRQPKVVKSRYGAWYLDPKTWKKQNVGEPLMDPKETGNGVHNLTTPPVKKVP
ncbi:uncharacterized protein LJ206_010907 [Theristicus caerulescens]